MAYPSIPGDDGHVTGQREKGCMLVLWINRLIFAVYHILRRDHILNFIRKQKKAAALSEKEVNELSRKKLEALLREALLHVPFYRDLAGEHLEEWLKNPDLQKFPLMDKQTIRANYEALQHDHIQQMKAIKSSTSGSTGESFFFMLSKDAQIRSDATFFRTYQYLKSSPLEAQATLWGARFDNKPAKGLKGIFKSIFKPFYFFSSYDLTDGKMAEMARILKDKKVKVLTSYSSPLEHFAGYVKKNHLSFPDLRGIICSSEQLFPHQRELFEQVFACPVFNRYGSREFGCIAHECEKHDGMHIEADRVWVEILDENLKPCKPGQIGELYLTNLDNYAMPLIRYRIGDMASWSDHKCSCGVHFPLLGSLEGRSFDLVRDSAGHVVSGTFWTLLTRFVSEEIQSFQVRQDELEKVDLLLVKAEPLTGEQEALLRQKVAETLPDLQVNIIYVDHIPLTKSGKRRFIISTLGK